MYDRQFERELSIINDLLLGYSSKFSHLLDNTDLMTYELPLNTAAVFKLSSDAEYYNKSNFTRRDEENEIIQIIKNVGREENIELAVSSIYPGYFVLFFRNEALSPSNESYQKSLDFIKIVLEKLKSEKSWEFTCGIGRSYEKIKGLLFSYREAADVCETAAFQQKEVAHIEELFLPANSEDEKENFLDLEEDLFENIDSSNDDLIPGIMRSIVVNICREKIQPDKIKLTVMEFINDLIKKLEEDLVDSGRFLENYYQYVEKIIDLTTEEELFALIERLSTRVVDIIRRSGNVLKDQKQIRRALLYMEDNYDRDLALEEVADEIGLSFYYFSHLFKEEVGENFITYLNRLRIRKAKELLRETNLNISEIAFKVGFNTPNYFTRVFKEFVNMPPSKYRTDNFGKKGF
ncbi:MAG: helix-turn-helix domain-containing protein [Bacillota bacterium]